MDTFIPTIPEVRELDIKAKFLLQTLTVIDGRPTYEKMLNCERELGKNALAIEVAFGDGNRGCLGTVYSAFKYLAEAWVAWDVPESKGAYQISRRMQRKMTGKEKFLPTSSARRESRL